MKKYLPVIIAVFYFLPISVALGLEPQVTLTGHVRALTPDADATSDPYLFHANLYAKTSINGARTLLPCVCSGAISLRYDIILFTGNYSNMPKIIEVEYYLLSGYPGYPSTKSYNIVLEQGISPGVFNFVDWAPNPNNPKFGLEFKYTPNQATAPSFGPTSKVCAGSVITITTPNLYPGSNSKYFFEELDDATHQVPTGVTFTYNATASATTPRWLYTVPNCNTTSCTRSFRVTIKGTPTTIDTSPWNGIPSPSSGNINIYAPAPTVTVGKTVSPTCSYDENGQIPITISGFRGQPQGPLYYSYSLRRTKPEPFNYDITDPTLFDVTWSGIEKITLNNNLFFEGEHLIPGDCEKYYYCR